MLAGTGLSGAVAAQRGTVFHRAQHGTIAVAPRPEPYSVEGQIERGCVPLCSRDTNPCDPFSFKRSDGRCSTSSN